MKSAILCFIFSASIAIAMPPLNYKSALSWADETVKSDIPKQNRIYILGPDKVTETYILNKTPTKHDVEVGRVKSYKPSLTLSALLKTLPIKEKKIRVAVHRSSEKAPFPCYVTEENAAFISDFLLQPRDVIEISILPLPGAIPAAL